MIPPCPTCRKYISGKTTLGCTHTGKAEPLFWATLKQGPEFKCYEEKNAPLRPNPR